MHTRILTTVAAFVVAMTTQLSTYSAQADDVAGRWSQSPITRSPPEEVAKIRAGLEMTRLGNYERDLEKATAMYKRGGERFHAFDIAPPLEDLGFARALQKSKDWYAGTLGPMIVEYNDPQILVDNNHAFVTSHFHFAFQMKDGRKVDTIGRASQIFEKIDGVWTCIHEHTSLPTTVGFSW